MDKITKIKAEIERRIAFQKECIKNSYRLTGKPEEEIILEYKQFLSFIDKLPEEPINNVWHDSNKEQPENHRTVVVWNPQIMDGEVLTFCVEVYKDKLWAYMDDLLYKQEEPASDNLEEAAKIYANENCEERMSDLDLKCAFKAGAQWQKTKSIVDACYHLEMRLPEHLDYNDIIVERKDFIDDFRKTLED